MIYGFNKYLIQINNILVLTIGLLVILASSTFAADRSYTHDLLLPFGDTLSMKDGKVKIIIDAGHGGHDPGCSGNHSTEKDITLKIALKLGEALEHQSSNVKVIYTRHNDEFIPLHKRINMANKTKADMFVSIHCNSSKYKSAQGSESYVMGVHTSDENLEVAKRENMVIALEDGYDTHYGQYNPNSPEGHIILSMFQNIYLEQSINIARLIESNLSTNNKNRSRGVKQAGFVVLRNAIMPSVLIESGFLSNPSEEKYLMSEEGQENIANSICKALLSYVEQGDIVTNSPVASHEVVEKTSKPKVVLHNRNETKIFKPQLTKKLYRVQIAATKNKKIDVKMGKWKDLDIIIIEKDKLFKYYTGAFDTKEAADKEKRRLRKCGFKGAFIVSETI